MELTETRLPKPDVMGRPHFPHAGEGLALSVHLVLVRNVSQLQELKRHHTTFPFSKTSMYDKYSSTEASSLQRLCAESVESSEYDQDLEDPYSLRS
jgi:hypothetical protein